MQIGAALAPSFPLSRASPTPASVPSAEQPLTAQETATTPVVEQTPKGEASGSNDDPAQREGRAVADKSEQSQQRVEQAEVAALARTDQEVRTHEQAHAAVGGAYAGSPSYTYTRGPDGKRYAVAGEVSIDTGSVPGDPEATLRKMQVVIRAALAPAEPSAQDRQVASQAQIKLAEARVELAAQQREAGRAEPQSEAADEEGDSASATGESSTDSPSANAQAGLATYQMIASASPERGQIDLSA